MELQTRIGTHYRLWAGTLLKKRFYSIISAWWSRMNLVTAQENDQLHSRERRTLVVPFFPKNTKAGSLRGARCRLSPTSSSETLFPYNMLTRNLSLEHYQAEQPPLVAGCFRNKLLGMTGGWPESRYRNRIWKAMRCSLPWVVGSIWKPWQQVN